jgi:hypothetical protein
VRETDYENKRKKIEKRNKTMDSTMISGSVIYGRQAVNEFQKVRQVETKAMRGWLLAEKK